MKSRAHTHTNCTPASPRSIKPLEKRQLIKLPFSSERRTERQMDREKRSQGEKMDDNNHNCRVVKKQRFPAHVCVHERVNMCGLTVDAKLRSSSFSTFSF